nr:serine protease [uncultured Roseateles sp.]
MSSRLYSFLVIICLGACASLAQAAMTELIANVKPSVLPVGTFNALDNPRFGFRGTGFVVGDGNLLVTNAHVLPEPTAQDLQQAIKLSVQVRRGAGSAELRQAVIVKVDKSSDLALLRFDGAPLPALRLGSSDSPREGLDIAFIGFPIGGALGFSPVTHRGMISSITPIALPSGNSQQLNERAIRRLREGSFNILQLDATAYPGNSGGPVFSAETGEVVGVINMVLIKGSKETALSQPSGISYAIPVSFVRELLASP